MVPCEVRIAAQSEENLGMGQPCCLHFVLHDSRKWKCKWINATSELVYVGSDGDDVRS